MVLKIDKFIILYSFNCLIYSLISIWGNEFSNTTGPITDYECSGGVVTSTRICVNRDCGACFSSRGVTSLESVNAYFEIKGGRCHSKCHGNIKIEYSPGVKG